MTCEATTRMAIGGLAPGGLGPSNPLPLSELYIPFIQQKKRNPNNPLKPAITIGSLYMFTCNTSE